MARLTCRKKLQRELKAITENPPENVPAVCVREEDICDWFALLQGPAETPYAGGWYIAKLRFPNDYPFKPPAISMLTPSGRFKVATRLCLSMSDFHPETWNPMWSVSAVLTGLLSFMAESAATTGSLESSEAEKRAIAAASLQHILDTPALRDLFPTLPALAAAAAAGDSPSLASLSLASASSRAADAAARAARAACDAGEPESAVRALEEALSALPPPSADDRGPLLSALASARLALGDFEAADAAAAAAGAGELRAAAAAAARAREAGNAAFAARRWPEAREAYEAGRRAAPGCATLAANVAAAAAQQQDWAAVAEAAAAALSLQRSGHKARRRLAEALLRLGRAGEALPHFRILAEAFPEDAGVAASLRAAAAAAAAAQR